MGRWAAAMPRWWGLLLAGLLVSGCAELHLTQDRSKLLVRVGDERKLVTAASHADLFLDYALLSDQSYADSLYPPRGKPFDVGPDTYCSGRLAPGDACRDTAGLTAYAIARLKRWRLIYASMDAADFRCPVGRAGCAQPTPGLGVQVWMRRGRVCPEAAIVFRGTDGQSADDWVSNLRFLLRLLPLYDQYEQVQDYTPAFVSTIEREPCFQRGRTRIVAVGHSLGGGLAQQTAFRDGRIRRVTAFDPSFVTGQSDLEPALVAETARGLGIERVYEHGEVLAYPRFVLRQLSPLPTCDPLIRTVRFNTLRGNPIDQHSLASMTTSLLAWSKERRAARLRADVPLPGPTPDSCAART